MLAERDEIVQDFKPFDTVRYEVLVPPLLSSYEVVCHRLANYAFRQLTTHQLANLLIPATLGRFDGSDFGSDEGCFVWIRDHLYAIQHATSPYVKTHFAHLFDNQYIKDNNLVRTSSELLTTGMTGLFVVQSRERSLRG